MPSFGPISSLPISSLPSVAAAVTLSWFSPLSEPVRHPAYEVVSDVVGFAAQRPAVPDISYQPWSEPTRRTGFPTYQQQSLVFVFAPAAEVVTEDKWHQPWSEPTRRKLSVTGYPALSWSGFTPAPSFWYQPLAEPPKRKTGVTAPPDLAWADFTPINLSWRQPWSEPTRRKAIPEHQAFFSGYFTPSAEVVTEDKWHQPWSEPTRRKVSAPDYFAWSTFTPAPTVVEYWYYPWSEPVRHPAHEVVSDAAGFAAIAHAAAPDISYQPWSEPTRPKVSVASQPSFAWGYFTPAVVVVNYWHAPWSGPVRVKQGLATHLQQFTTHFGVQEFFPVVISGGAVTATKALQYQALVEPVSTQPETVTESRWHQPWSEPVRRKPATPSHFAWSTFTPAAVTDIRWFAPLSEPVRVKAALQPTLQSFFTVDADPVVSFGWSDGLSEPVRTRILPTAQQQALAWSAFTPAAVTDIRWFVPLNEPVRLKPGLGAWQQAFFTTDTDPIVSFGWADKLSEPVRRKPIAEYPSFAWGAFTPAAINDLRWFAPLSEPVRTRWMAASQRPFFAADAKPSVSFSWFDRLAEPVRQKPGVHASRQPFFVWSVKPTVSFAWFDRLAEPVRVKSGLRASLQQWLAFVKAAPFPETVTESRWHQPWSEPVRYRWFHPAYQQAQVQSPRVDVTGITISLDVTETGDVFTGRLTIGFCPQADVSIVEIVAQEADASTAYVPDVFAEVSIIEVPQDVVYVEVSIIETC